MEVGVELERAIGDEDAMLEAALDGFGTGVDADAICEGTDDGNTAEELRRVGVLVGINIAELD